MKKLVNILLVAICSLLALMLCFYLYYLAITFNTKIDKSKLVNLDNYVIYCDKDGVEFAKDSGKNSITTASDIPKNLINAFVSIEDKRFYEHNGIDKKGLFRAIAKNVKTLSFKEGASTISQQLIKNTHLSNEKTLKRKLIEIKLAKKLEKIYSKKQIISMYLNTIYFGDNCYGITNASKHYFDKLPNELTISECASLAGLVKAPSEYSPTKNYDKCIKRRNIVLKQMLNQGYINNAEYLTSIAENINVENNKNYYDFLHLARQELQNIIDKSPYQYKKIKVYTSYDKNIQENLETTLKNAYYNTDQSGIILNNNSNVLAYFSTTGEIKRQVGSIIKPILVYAPAIEEKIIYPCSLILDEKTNFNGYSPSNFNDKYYGYVSAKYSLAHSLNVPAIKILNSTTIDKSFKYLDKIGLKYQSSDKNLSSALGGFSKGFSLLEITNAYNVFANDGNYVVPSVISKIYSDNKLIYSNTATKTQVFTKETAFLVDDMLKYVVKSGTAKKLGFNKYNLSAKTGTVGNKNGNTDAYCVSYNKDYCMGIWYGNKDNSLMKNNITGGNCPANASSLIWEKIGKENKEIAIPSGITKLNIDKISYEQEKKILLADYCAPKRYVIEEYFDKKNIPTKYSNRFNLPKIENKEIFVNNNEITMRLCVAEWYEYLIYVKKNNKKQIIFDSKNNLRNDIVIKNLQNGEYQYYALPYQEYNGKITFGKEEAFPKIKI